MGFAEDAFKHSKLEVDKNFGAAFGCNSERHTPSGVPAKRKISVRVTGGALSFYPDPDLHAGGEPREGSGV